MHLNSSSKLSWTSILMWTCLVIERERGQAIFLGTEERQGSHGWPAAAVPADERGQAVAGKWGKRERGVRAADSPTHLRRRRRTEARPLRRVDRGGGCYARWRWRARDGEGWEGAHLVDMAPTKRTPGAPAPASGPRVGELVVQLTRFCHASPASSTTAWPAAARARGQESSTAGLHGRRARE
jgi:hypothetical protein